MEDLKFRVISSEVVSFKVVSTEDVEDIDLRKAKEQPWL